MIPSFKAHPWHGISAGEKAPEVVTVYVEIVPSDTIKYEVDKESGYLKVDRPQKFSNIIPALYGFIPRTYCDEEVKKLAVESGAKDVTMGDHDPLDICVLSSHHIQSGNLLMDAIPIGGFKMIDKGEADDKIIAVMVGDQSYGHIRDISELPEAEIKRLKHYFLTYKNLPYEEASCRIDETYGAEYAKKVVEASLKDYQTNYGE
ncbi:inorganic pyrophosphatase [Riemerella anatipestifer]|uniref:inorganic diphosphatase n=1 Tax=Riemerella anatipestifer (strain ATCC 11845 / DSM 15868 / JCM 9532 / NCTC 11014) TaxID=693978 RepID=E4T9K3_RIEAD|nr:inorganic pyrophosphatase [Riemerella anatipestifer]ADQ81684.1 Inorganic diphosphatase [Riemerella anatipestifer ATCC 11845 = DSM 15868]AFD55695.1 inorganic diphosphatase [Riemerella anatipestifer ATCC 11845 = DSM 15868]MBT0550537.1 inorganic pyrophosphatase [Riemerella anatipestifer]MBT0553353.1 inorganic pyrophosphatase [Riemerella anatipestifer]MCE3023351.1 inorganic pyrophosphatase [Riemerella anatipestifer]